MKTLLKKIKTNGMILGVALLLAIAIFYIKNNPDIFLASILSLQEQEYITEKWRDAAYKTENGNFEIFLDQKYTGNISKFYGMVYLNPEKVHMDIANYTGQGTINIQEGKDGSLTINITDLKDITTAQEIVGIPFTGDAGLVLLGETKGRIKNRRQKFAVGNLSKFVPHTK
jgi:hypothetical protein